MPRSRATPSTIDATPSAPVIDTASTTAIPAIPTEAGPEPLRDAAANGDSKALFEIGNRYMDGRGVTSDFAKAAEWYNLAAERGFAPAQYRIGNFYEKGLGLTRDLAKAKTYYQLAAEQGNASAMHNLAVLFAAGTDGAARITKPPRAGLPRRPNSVSRTASSILAFFQPRAWACHRTLKRATNGSPLRPMPVTRTQRRSATKWPRPCLPNSLRRAKAAAELWKPKPMNPDANALNVPEEWRESPTTTGSIDMEKAIRNVQLILNKHGYDAGGSDGKIGSKTRDAIMAFQKDNGLKPTGNIDKDLVRNLLRKNG